VFSKDKYINTTRYIKIVSILGYIIILLALNIIINSHSPNVYGFSIYKMYPWYFWVLISMAIFIGQIILMYNAISKYETNTWHIGFLMIIISNLVLLFMPIIKGYFIHGREDVLTHVGYMIDIENNHKIGSNAYPMLHIIGFTLKCFSGISYNDITMFLPIFYSLLYIFSWYILGKYVFKNKREMFIMLAFSSILLLGSKNVMLSPNGQAILFVPFFLYIFFKSRLPKKAVPYSILLIILSFFIIFSHPLITILLTVTILLSDFTMYLNNKSPEIKIKKSTNLLSIMVCSFLVWSSYLHILAYSLENIMYTLMSTDGGSSEFGRYQTSLSSVHISLLEIVGMVLSIYGPYLLLSVLSAICIIYIIAFRKKDNIKVNYYHKLSILGWILLVFFSLLLFILNDQFGFVRVYSYSIFFSVILIAYSIGIFLRRSSDKRNSNLKFLMAISSVLILITGLSTYSLFLSPAILKIDQQTPESEFSAMKTFYKVKENSYPVLERGTVNYRVHNAIYGVSGSKKKGITRENQVIDHFGYDNNSSLSDSYKKSYLLISYIGRNQDQNLLPKFQDRWSFNYSDFMHLDNDVGVTKIYSDKFSDVYIISP
jgi:hypothetical protein